MSVATPRIPAGGLIWGSAQKLHGLCRGIMGRDQFEWVQNRMWAIASMTGIVYLGSPRGHCWGSPRASWEGQVGGCQQVIWVVQHHFGRPFWIPGYCWIGPWNQWGMVSWRCPESHCIIKKVQLGVSRSHVGKFPALTGCLSGKSQEHYVGSPAGMYGKLSWEWSKGSHMGRSSTIGGPVWEVPDTLWVSLDIMEAYWVVHLGEFPQCQWVVLRGIDGEAQDMPIWEVPGTTDVVVPGTWNGSWSGPEVMVWHPSMAKIVHLATPRDTAG
ncbi:hypothetical protein BU15DRAFT_68561 [Melanogaster broomeanus]|nr:hypothetical protein BU15DRAFT_68561 [Melanogaster broomeanus]